MVDEGKMRGVWIKDVRRWVSIKDIRRSVWIKYIGDEREWRRCVKKKGMNVDEGDECKTSETNYIKSERQKIMNKKICH